MKHETNEAFVVRIMNYCPFGALSQAFIIEAIARYADLIADENTVIPDSPWMRGAVWKCTGQWVKSEMDKHLNLNKDEVSRDDCRHA